MIIHNSNISCIMLVYIIVEYRERARRRRPGRSLRERAYSIEIGLNGRINVTTERAYSIESGHEGDGRADLSELKSIVHYSTTICY